MYDQETAAGGSGRAFETTPWSVLKKLKEADTSGRQEALERLSSQYWKPVYCLIRKSWGKKNEDAKDLTQEYFAAVLLEGTMIEKYERERGSFRAFLKASVRNFLLDAQKAQGRQKRGGGAPPLSLSVGDVDVARLVPRAEDLTAEEVFDSAWRGQVMGHAVEALEKKLTDDGKETYFSVFKAYDLHDGDGEPSYGSVGEALGLSSDTVKNYLTKSRQLFREAVMGIIGEYVDTDEDFSRELSDLLGS